ncbi:uncharacterized protein RCC_00004 [Ramularia collo-cygni]|uniref:Zn(2)-C6 fungal-type domain-containing protein n=1 Tax=Ramularia collo-cygni TaxID=112498 RepID=A0A2D3UXZ3_9PEZI|nr:uncharacterized protein RCC_00004 [Ramularia collo-cygni]CZT14029.1 uncharacterized protein RCC_00004 [Ramularia collo-cygni]
MSDASSPALKKRKWHTKDQNGCTRCKARHVKCEKSQPSCRNCVRRGEECIYPALYSAPQTPMPPVTDPGDSVETVPVRDTFSALDLELFHRFITTDYPPLPANSTHIWTQIMSVYAHDHDFLMHAILACAATSSTANPRPGLRVSALHHRMIALKCIWGAMAVADSKETSSRTRDALLGAWYLLAMQCFLLRDGWTDFFPLVRGLNLTAGAILLQGGNTVWGLDRLHVTKERIRDEWKDGRIERPPRPLMSGMMESFRLMETECQSHRAQAFLQIVITAATALDQDETWKGYETLQSVWDLLSNADCVDSKALEDCSNPSSRILMAHWLAMMLLLKPFYDLEVVLGKQGVIAQLPTWIFDISRVASRDSDNTEEMLQWPLQVASAYASRNLAQSRPESQEGAL